MLVSTTLRFYIRTSVEICFKPVFQMKRKERKVEHYSVNEHVNCERGHHGTETRLYVTLVNWLLADPDVIVVSDN